MENKQHQINLTKQCNTCSIIQNIDNFNKNQNKCKDCQKIYNKQYRLNHKEEIKQKQKEYNIEHKDEIRQKQKEYNIDHKQINKKLSEKRKEERIIKKQIEKELRKNICTKCFLKKEDCDFSKNNLWCKDCVSIYNEIYRKSLNKEQIKIYQQQYANDNKERLQIYHKEYYEQNKEVIKQYKIDYYQNNKIEINNLSNENQKERRKNDPAFKLRQYISRSIYIELKNNNSSKNGKSCAKFLSYTIKELKAHIEQQFEPWMNWNNHGKYIRKDWDDNNPLTWKWQLDHIIPHSTFKYTSMNSQEFKDCWALSNLRPYSAKQNLIDGVSKTRHK